MSESKEGPRAERVKHLNTCTSKDRYLLIQKWNYYHYVEMQVKKLLLNNIRYY